MALWAKSQFMDRSVTPKRLYRSQLRFHLYNILGVTDWSINCNMALRAMNYPEYSAKLIKKTYFMMNKLCKCLNLIGYLFPKISCNYQM